MLENNTDIRSGIAYSCYHQISREGEHFVPNHTLSFQIAGSLVLQDGELEYPSQVGRLRFIRRNQLVKFVKTPPENGEFKAINIYFDQAALQQYSLEFGIKTTKTYSSTSSGIIDISKNEALEYYIRSLVVYNDANSLKSDALIKLKIQEGLILLLQAEPSLADILFDFTEPFKIDLEAFMNQNYTFNVHLDRFAYLTGRSLATFKRDFEKIFNSSPRKWLQKKRLQQAVYLLTKKRKSISDTYLDVGFEDLTHFSHSFKKEFGISPREYIQKNSTL